LPAKPHRHHIVDEEAMRLGQRLCDSLPPASAKPSNSSDGGWHASCPRRELSSTTAILTSTTAILTSLVHAAPAVVAAIAADITAGTAAAAAAIPQRHQLQHSTATCTPALVLVLAILTITCKP
jgi:hypothetical protein